MRLVLVSPHIENLAGIPAIPAYMGAKFSPKYNWLRLLCDRQDLEVALYIDGEWTSAGNYYGPEILSHLHTTPGENHKICEIDAARWCLLSGFPLNKIKFLYAPEEIQSSDIVFFFSMRFLGDPTLLQRSASANIQQLLARTDIIKLAHMTHYGFNTKVLAENIDRFQIKHFCHEVNLSQYSFFKKHFPHILAVTIIPFAYKDRFKNITPFKSRTNRCIATGFTQKLEPSTATFDLIDFFGDQPLHPIRWNIYHNKDNLADVIQSYITMYHDEQRMLMKGYEQFPPVLDALSCDLGELKKEKKPDEKSYFTSFDIVKTFNDYRMFVPGEELWHSPGIGFVEGMACGCALIAIDDPMYTDLGLVPGKHYITYDGTLGGLKTCIEYYQKNEEALETIARAGCDYVRQHFSEIDIANKFYAAIATWSRSTPSVPTKSAPARVRTRLSFMTKTIIMARYEYISMVEAWDIPDLIEKVKQFTVKTMRMVLPRPLILFIKKCLKR